MFIVSVFRGQRTLSPIRNVNQSRVSTLITLKQIGANRYEGNHSLQKYLTILSSSTFELFTSLIL